MHQHKAWTSRWLEAGEIRFGARRQRGWGAVGPRGIPVETEICVYIYIYIYILYAYCMFYLEIHSYTKDSTM